MPDPPLPGGGGTGDMGVLAGPLITYFGEGLNGTSISILSGITTEPKTLVTGRLSPGTAPFLQDLIFLAS